MIFCPNETMAVPGGGDVPGATGQRRIAMATESSGMERASEALAMSKVEVAQMLGVSVRTVDRLIALKELPVRRLAVAF